MAVLEKVMLAQGTRFRNLNGLFALENKKKQFRQPQKGTRMHKKRYEPKTGRGDSRKGRNGHKGRNLRIIQHSPSGWHVFYPILCLSFCLGVLCALCVKSNCFF
jgi:hypothetical protein